MLTDERLGRAISRYRNTSEPVASIAQWCGISERQLRRVFSKYSVPRRRPHYIKALQQRMEGIVPVPNPDLAPDDPCFQTFGKPRFCPGFRVVCDNFLAAEDVRTAFPEATPKQVERALDWAWDDLYDQLTAAAQAIAEDLFGTGVTVYTAGADGLTLGVTQLGDYRQWDAREYRQGRQMPSHNLWDEFRHNVLAELEHLSDKNRILLAIYRHYWPGIGRIYCHTS